MLNYRCTTVRLSVLEVLIGAGQVETDHIVGYEAKTIRVIGQMRFFAALRDSVHHGFAKLVLCQERHLFEFIGVCATTGILIKFIRSSHYQSPKLREGYLRIQHEFAEGCLLESISVQGLLSLVGT